MPEICEIKLMTDALKELLINKKITSFENIRPFKMPATLSDFKMFLKEGKAICVDIQHNGKMMWFKIENEKNEKWYVFNTFGLFGGWVLSNDPNEKTEKHNCVRLSYLENTTERSVYYRDSSKFGTFRITKDEQEIAKILKSRGVDVCQNEITIDVLNSQLKRIKKPMELCQFLMKQDYLSGIGNYLKAEILYVAKLSPHRLTNELTTDQKTALCNAINNVIREVLSTNGRLIKYSDLLGTNIPQYAFKVYQRTVDDEGNEIKCEETKDDRTTYWVPTIQL